MTSATLFAPQTPPGLFTSPPPSPSAPLGSSDGTNAISGGLLRPGSIDQTTFLQMLQQQQQNRQAAGVGGKPVAMPVPGPIQGAQPGIPTLSSAQFAALVGPLNADPGLAGAPVEGLAADPQAMAAAQQAYLQTQARLAVPTAAAPALRLSGAANRNALPNGSSQAANPPVAGNADWDAPTISRAANPQQMAAAAAAAPGDEVPTITRQNAAAAAEGDGEPEEKPAKTETASKADPNVVHLKSPPDKDEQKELRMRNKRWVVDETPGARQLFFGADGVFGWDDFLDLINPLQHIPGIAQIYRAVTGDEINGAASLLGAIPFGPLGGVGLIASVADLAVKDTSGKDIGANLQAMVFGDDDKSKDRAAPVPADMADAGTLEDGADGQVTVQTAARESRYALADASALHAACRG